MINQFIDHNSESGYIFALETILHDGAFREPEGEEGRYELFTIPLTFDLKSTWTGDTYSGTLPLLQSKRVWFKGLASEMLWFISGSLTCDSLEEHDIGIWRPWYRQGTTYVGPMYGHMWRQWPTFKHDEETGEPRQRGFFDQLQSCIDSIRNRPEARSHIVTAWNPSLLEVQPIKPCHVMFQFFAPEDATLQLTLFQRSCDMFLGVPFNIAQYSLLGHMVASLTGRLFTQLNWIGADCHIYENHEDQVQEQIARWWSNEGRCRAKPQPRVSFSVPESIDDFTFSDFRLSDYSPLEPLQGEVSIQGKGHKEESF